MPRRLPPRSVSLGAGEPASDSFDVVRDRCIDFRFFGAGLCEGADSGGADAFDGSASEPRRESGCSGGTTADQ